MSEVTMKPVTMIPEEDETRAIYVSRKPSRNLQETCYPGQHWRIIGMNVIKFILYAHVYTRNNDVVLIITES